MLEQEAIEHLMRALLPGGAGFPAARTEATHLLAARLHQADPALPGKLLAFWTTAPTNWTAAAAALEQADPKLFDAVRKYAYLTYYEQPDVIAAIRALGHPYNDSPLPDGYPDEAFDPARDAPRHKVGHWRDEADIRPVDPATLDLEVPR